ncbi:MAG: hypothetical protein LUO89_05050 [Methanothrix sp.]|nr:hypothetical protein [Methanothrix sp.]
MKSRDEKQVAEWIPTEFSALEQMGEEQRAIKATRGVTYWCGVCHCEFQTWPTMSQHLTERMIIHTDADEPKYRRGAVLPPVYEKQPNGLWILGPERHLGIEE